MANAPVNTQPDFLNTPFVDASGRLTPAAKQIMLKLYRESFSKASPNETPDQLLEQAAVNGMLAVPPSVL